MRRSRLFTLIAAITFLFFSAIVASAQTGQLRGHVVLKQADGTTVKAAGAQVDVYRTDLPGNYPTKTDKSGGFVYAGLPYVGTYVIAVSMPNAAPTSQYNVKAGRDVDYELVLSPGDGKRLTLDDVKKSTAGGGGSAASSAGGERDGKKPTAGEL